MDYTKKTILITIVFCVVSAGVCAVGAAGEQGKSRVIHFPKDRSLGRIMVIDGNIKRRIRTFYYSGDGVDWHTDCRFAEN